jgi:hypothetical protein
MDRADRAMYQEKFRKAPKPQPKAAAATHQDDELPTHRAGRALGGVNC